MHVKRECKFRGDGWKRGYVKKREEVFYDMRELLIRFLYSWHLKQMFLISICNFLLQLCFGLILNLFVH